MSVENIRKTGTRVQTSLASHECSSAVRGTPFSPNRSTWDEGTALVQVVACRQVDWNDPRAVNFHCNRPLQQSYRKNETIAPAQIGNQALQSVKAASFDPHS